MPRVVRWLLIAVLAATLIYRGLAPAWRETPGDFVNYWLPARTLVEGGAVGALMDDEVFAAELVRRGIPPAGRASQFPPPSVFVGVPWALADVHVAARLLLLTKLALLVPIAWLGARVARVGLVDALLVGLASGAALGNDFHFGQIYLLILGVLFGCTGGVLRGASAPAAAAVAVLASIKLFPVIWLPFAARKAPGAAGAALGLALAAGLGALAVGPSAAWHWATAVLVPHLDGNLGPQGSWAWQFQSLNVLCRRLFLLHPVENPDPMWPWAAGPALVKVAVYAVAAGWVARGWRRAGLRSEEDATRLRAGLVGVVALALAPATTTYQLLLLWAPVAWVWPVAERRAGIALVATVIALGWVPYGVFFRLGAEFTPLGFPRLALLGVAAVAAGQCSARRSSNPRGS